MAGQGMQGHDVVPEDAREVRRTDPAPYAWLDDRTALRGAMPLGLHVALGALLTGLGLYGVVALWARSRPGALFFAAFTLLGVYVLRMAVRRRAWRRRHPGVDPVAASTMDEGGPVAADGVGGTVWRWLLWLAGAAVALLGLAGVVESVAGPGPRPVSDRVVGGVVCAVFLALGFFVARLVWRLMPRRSDADAALGLPPSRWGGAGPLARGARLVLVPVSAALAALCLLAAVEVAHDPTSENGPVTSGSLVVLAVGAGALAAALAGRALAVHRARRGRAPQ